MVPALCEIGRACAVEIDAILARGGFMATGEAKIVDNAIMGFTQSRRRDQPAADGAG